MRLRSGAHGRSPETGVTASAPAGVLLMAYGSPSTPFNLLAYYTDILRGRTPSPHLLAELAARYQCIGGVSPLNRITEAQAAELQRQLDAREPGAYRVCVGMKHWDPRIPDVLARMARDRIRNVLGVVLAPQYSRLSVGDYHARVRSAAGGLDAPMELDLVEGWHLEPAFVRAVGRRVQAAMARFAEPERRDTLVVFTAHSLPSRILDEGDPYPAQIAESAQAVAEIIGLPRGRWITAWQSAGRTPEPWLGPDVKQVIANHVAVGTSRFVVCPIGFVADHMETLYDLDIDLRAHANALAPGVRLERTPSLNADPDFIAALVDVIRARVPARALV